MTKTTEERTYDRLLNLGKRLEGLGVTEEYGSRFFIEKETPTRIDVSYMDDGQSNANSEGNLGKQQISLLFTQSAGAINLSTYPENEARLREKLGDSKSMTLKFKSPVDWEQALANWAYAISGNINIPKMI